MRTAAAARERAYTNEAQQIEASQQRALAARQAEDRPKPRNALEAMAARLEVSASGLKDTLWNTVFAGCRSDAEFMMLVLVSNELELNPMKKEIYAFPVKGGGIMPMVSIDGWIRIMNRHPQFDGIEFEYTIGENGKVDAIESIIYCKDRKHPVKTIEFMDECVRNTEPWNKSPRRMLRHRALIQGVRIAFGITGAIAEGDENAIEADFRVVEPTTLPRQQTLAQELDDEIPNFDRQADPQTGEIFDRDERGFTQVDEDTARQLDAGNDGTLSDDNPTAREGRDDSQMGEQGIEDEAEPAWLAQVRSIRGSVAAAKTIKAIYNIERDWTNRVMNGVPDENVVRGVDQDIAAKKRKLQQEAK